MPSQLLLLTMALSSLHKKRGAARSSITRLNNRLKDLEADPEVPGASDRAKHLLSKLNGRFQDTTLPGIRCNR